MYFTVVQRFTAVVLKKKFVALRFFIAQRTVPFLKKRVLQVNSKNQNEKI